MGSRVLHGVGLATASVGGLVAVQLAATRRRSFLIDPPPDELPSRFEGPGADLTLTVIGDSTGVGVGAGSRSQSYPAVLARKLSADLTVELVVFGRSGLRMAEVASRVAREVADHGPDLVVLGVGANDAIHMTSLGKLRRQTAAVLDELVASGADVLVALGPRMESPALRRPLRDAVAWRCRTVNRIIRAEARRRRIAFVDTAVHIGDAFLTDPRRYYCEDLFHPGPDGYALWAEAVFPALRALVRRRTGSSLTAPSR